MNERPPHGRSERGASLVEYSLLVTLIALACFLAIRELGDATKTSFSQNATSIADAG